MLRYSAWPGLTGGIRIPLQLHSPRADVQSDPDAQDAEWARKERARPPVR